MADIVHLPLAYWLTVLAGITFVGLVIYEHAGLAQVRVEAYVLAKQFVPEAFDPFSTAMQFGGDQGIGSERYVPEQHRVTVQANGREHVMLVEPQLFRAIEVGSKVELICTHGRLTNRPFLLDLVIPMPDRTEGQALHS